MRLHWAVLGFVLVSCGEDPIPPDAPEDAAPIEPAELAGMTEAHNNVRAMVSAGNPLPPLEWDPALEATARAWVAMCRDQQAPMGLLDHNPNRSVGHPYYVGENIFGASGGIAAGTVQQAVSTWAMEAQSYDYATNTCPGGVCGHYTQIVWRASTKLGCAMGECPSLQYRTTVVCNYGPGGNNPPDQRPY